MSTGWLVEIEVKRVQGWLFSMPVLRAMVGANALLGETMRGRVVRGPSNEVRFADEGGGAPESLPALVGRVRGGVGGSAEWKRRVEATRTRFAGRPLNDDAGVDQDDPLSVARDAGILSRDGGHFDAYFDAEKEASAFMDGAAELLAAKLPGLPFSIRCRSMASGEVVARGRAAPASVFDLPQAETCELSGSDVASVLYKPGDEQPIAVGEAAWSRLAAGDRFDKGGSHDVLGLMRSELLKASGRQGGKGESSTFPRDMEEVAISGFAAVIHIDGDGIGSRIQEARRGAASGGPVAEALAGERAAHEVRSRYRLALVQAIKELAKERPFPLPLRPLMLGGDDLVLVCDASFGLPFVEQFARAIDGPSAAQVQPRGSGSRDFPSGAPKPKAGHSFGAGVAIVPVGFPFHRAHDVAEELTQSAKRLSKPTGRSAVDWVLVTESWHGSVASVRHSQFARRCGDENLALSMRPYFVRDATGEATEAAKEPRTLGRLLQVAGELADGGGARTAIKGLVDVLPLGRNLATLHASELSPTLAKRLSDHGLLCESGPWTFSQGASGSAGAVFGTRIVDLAELIELRLLANASSRPGRRGDRRRGGLSRG